MTIEAGQSLLHYRLVEKIGEGGMGIVWKAIDTTLDREVAIKVLPEGFAADAERLARFEREAKLLASLNHPNIAAVYGLHAADPRGGLRFLAMELVPGKDLAERLASGAMPMDEALDAARQVAEGLAAAHDAGVIHRDLKPANVKLAPDGTVKVLDFGLAKGVESDATSGGLSMSPTVTSVGSVAGMILGTASYMSPEQARGRPVDRRTDVWSFGCLLYEMLTGRQAFGGETVSDLIAQILQTEPDASLLPAETPPPIRRLLRRCLVKDPQRRLRDIGDTRLEIADAAAGTETAAMTPAEVPPSIQRWRRLLPWTMAALLAVWLAGSYLDRPQIERAPVRFSIAAPEGFGLGEFSISPDGRRIAFVATEQQGARQIWLRTLDEDRPHSLPETQDATFPFWSPDSRSIAFFAEGELRRIDLDTETTQVIADAPNGRGGAWSPEGIILFAPEGGDRLFTVPESGGTAEPLTTLVADWEASHRFPHFLPDGRQFIYLAHDNSGGRSESYLGSLDSSDRTLLLDKVSESYAPAGYLLFVHELTLIARRLDDSNLRLAEEAYPLARNVLGSYPRNGRASFSVSDNGVLVYRSVELPISNLVWFDRTGKRLAAVGPADRYGDPKVSPDGRRVAFARSVRIESREHEIWMLDMEDGSLSRFASVVGNIGNSEWTSDGNGIVFTYEGAILGNRVGSADEPETLLPAGEQDDPEVPAWPSALHASADGRSIVLDNWDPATDWDIWILPLDGERKPSPLLKAPGVQHSSEISPDSRWLAYESDESGSTEVYVMDLGENRRKWLVSTGGGNYPRFSPDGSELFYVAPDGMLMAVPVRKGRGFEMGDPVALFQAPQGISAGFTDLSLVPHLVSAQGQRFLFRVSTGPPERPAMNVVLNWTEDLRAGAD